MHIAAAAAMKYNKSAGLLKLVFNSPADIIKLCLAVPRNYTHETDISLTVFRVISELTRDEPHLESYQNQADNVRLGFST